MGRNYRYAVADGCPALWQDPGQLGTVQNNLRFPGQYYDARPACTTTGTATTTWTPGATALPTP